MAAVEASIAGIRLRNPFLLASGIWGESGDSLLGAYRAGAGGVVTKSIGTAPRAGYPNPTVETYERWGMLNAMGLPNPGIEEYPQEVARARSAGVPVIGSVFAGDPEEFADVSRRMAATGVVALELNLSCPHAKGLGSEVGSDPAEVERVVRAVVGAVSIPVFAKITPNTSDAAALGLAAERGGAAGVSAINTLRALAIDVTLRRPVLAHGLGGLSGAAVKPVGLAVVWQLYEALHVPVIGIGGIRTVDDAIEYALAGAAAVELGTAVAFDGIGVFTKFAQELPRRLEELGFESWHDAVGAAHPAGPPTH
ncbi:MAG TPA: dihydroorotate dehydrogenase [Thermoplasmata archaeon]|nr:dihydroorotate dehydrogenase [Thermoplasmata archaeon]